MNKQENVMLDLETLSTRPNALILTIGAIKFTRGGDMLPLDQYDTFYRRIDWEKCTGLGMHISRDTMDWWRVQDTNSKYEAFLNPDRVPIQTALSEFSAWFGNDKPIWSNGSDFDCVVLGEAYEACQMTRPWKYTSIRDCRTIIDLARLNMNDIPKTDHPHHALYDCYRQINAVKQCIVKLAV